MLDAAAIVRAAVAIPSDVQADLMIRAGYLALRRIAGAFGIPFEPDPRPDMETSIPRARFDAAIAVLGEAGVPIVADREQAWRDFNGWRVNYDEAPRGLERLTVAPTPWWDLPMRSAWATDGPVTEIAAAHGGTSRLCPVLWYSLAMIAARLTQHEPAQPGVHPEVIQMVAVGPTCNIGPAELRRRRRTAALTGGALVVAVAAVAAGLLPSWTAPFLAPLAGAAVAAGLQVTMRFCVAFGLAGVAGMGAAPGHAPVDPALLAPHRRRATLMLAASGAVTALWAVVTFLLVGPPAG